MLDDECFASERVSTSQVDQDLDEMVVKCSVGKRDVNN